VTDSSRLSFAPVGMQVDAIHDFLTQSDRTEDIAPAVAEGTVAGSLCIGAFAPTGEEIGVARVITHRASVASRVDGYVLGTRRGHSLAAHMVTALHDHAERQGLRRGVLPARDAHTLHSSLGWTALEDSKPFMQRHVPDVHKRQTDEAAS